MKSVSEITGKFYEDEDCCFFRNYVQAAHYYAWGAKLVDLFVDDNMKWVYVFKKSDHRKYFDRWINQNKEKEESL